MDCKEKKQELKKKMQSSPEDVRQELIELIKEYEDKDDNECYYDFSMLLSDTYSHLGRYDEAMKLLDHLDIQFAKDLKKNAGIHNYRGNTFWYQGKYLNALEEYLQVKKSAEQLKDESLLHAAYNNIGMIYWIREDYKASIENYEKALKYVKDNNQYDIANSKNNIALCYIRLNKIEDAKTNLHEALKIFEKEGDKKFAANAYLNLGNCEHILENQQDAIKYIQKALKIKKDIDDRWGMCHCLITIAQMGAINGDNEYSEAAALEGLEIAESINAIDHKKSANFILSNIYEEKGDFEKALEFFVKFYEIEKEMNQKDTNDKFLELKESYEIKEKEKEKEIYRLRNIELKKKNKLISEQKKQLDSAMSELKKLNENLQSELKAQLDNLRKKDQMLMVQSKQASMGEMLACIAHQWKQPLNGISVITQDLIDAWEYDELDDEYIQKSSSKIMNLVTFMSNTVNDFRNFFSPELQATDFSLSEVVNKTLNFVKYSFSKSNIDIQLNLEDISAHGFPNYYSQVVMNIINNARDALEENKVIDPQIKISSWQSNGKAILAIEDNAGGISKANFKNIFDPYYTTKAKDKGTGLGLYMSKVIIESNMHGHIYVENKLDGACFRIEI